MINLPFNKLNKKIILYEELLNKLKKIAQKEYDIKLKNETSE